MRVALLTNFVPPYRVPFYRAIRDRVGELRVLISTAMEPGRPWAPSWGDLDVVVQKTWTLNRTWRHERFTQPYTLHFPYDTLPQLKSFRPDVILTGEFGLRTVQALSYAKLTGTPVVIWATLADHLEKSRGRIREMARRVMVRVPARVIVNGESGARYIRSLGAPDSLLARVQYTTDMGPFLATPLERDASAARRLIFSGQVSELKGIDLMLGGLRLWGERHPEETVALRVVGDGEWRERMQAVALPANVRVEWVGAVAYSELAGHYAACGILAYPTRGDEWGLVVNEAMAAGLPVMGSLYSQAVDELVVDGTNGWRFVPDSEEAVAVALERALATPDDVLSAMRAHARATVTPRTPEWAADQLLEVIRSALPPGRSAGARAR